MFTVVIAQQAYLDDLQKYGPYMKPYLKNKEVAYCNWNPEAQVLSEAVPELDSLVSSVKQWRAIIICDEAGLHQQNPFLAVPLSVPEQEPSEEFAAYLDRVREVKFRAYAQAATKPLTRLATWLCADPLVSGSPIALPTLDEEDEDDDEADKEVEKNILFSLKDDLLYNSYLEEAQKKIELRRQIRDGSHARFVLPSEILCISRRTYTMQKDDIRASWCSEPNLIYSRFFDWNLYFDKMRYLLFDILPKNDNGYALDSLRLLNAVAILATHDTPMDALQPNTVYRLCCDTNEEALQTAVCTYDARMELTEEALKQQIRDLKAKERPHLTDLEAEKLFCISTPIAVTIPQKTSLGEMTVAHNELGLAKDCPSDEEVFWAASYRTSKHALLHFLKQPRRSLQQAAQDVHGREYASLREADRLNEFQLEDVASHTQEEELAMIDADTSSLYDSEPYLKKMETASEVVYKEIRSRMFKKPTLIIGFVVLACCLCGFLPLFFSNLNNAKTVVTALLLAGIYLGVTAIILTLTLLYLRHLLKKKISEYNNTVLEIQGEVGASIQQYAAYLTHTCNVLRGNSVINYRRQTGDPDRKEILIYKKHILDIEESRSELRALFGTYLHNRKRIALPADEIYDYDFRRPVRYEYLITFSDKQTAAIEFFQPDVTVDVPIDFIRRLGARREELYD